MGDSTGLERREFLGTLALLGMPGLATGPLLDRVSRASSAEMNASPQEPAPGFPRNALDRVQSVVGASHSNFDRVRELVLEQPELAKASWDWGFGDWETALGAASHTGRREIAEFLIAHSARPTLFSAAMLGQVDTVRAFLTQDPALFRLPGPHGITLMRHAQSGGAEAASVVDYLTETFGSDDRPFGFPGDDALQARYGGSYRFPTTPPAVIQVGVRNRWLMVGAGDEPNSRVLQIAEHTFHPTGAPGVRLRFELEGGRAERLIVEDGPLQVTGVRVAG